MRINHPCGIMVWWQSSTLIRLRCSLNLMHPRPRRRVARPSGPFSNFLFPCTRPPAGYPFRAVSWNARALFCRNPRTLHHKVQFLNSFARQSTYICLQETHGSPEMINKHLVLIKRDFWIFSVSYCSPRTISSASPELGPLANFQLFPQLSDRLMCF